MENIAVPTSKINRGNQGVLRVKLGLIDIFTFFLNMIKKEFRPSIWHPYYFIRQGLYKKLFQYKGIMKGKMLDFGCGSKPYQSLFEVTEYIGVDFVNEGHPHDDEQIDVYYDGHTIPIPDETFDSALSSEVFEHIFNLEEILQELKRVLKPGAPLLITCPFVWKEHEVPHDFARYTHFALKHLLEKNGFRVEIFDKSGSFIEVIFQLKVLYFFDTFYSKVAGIPLINQLFRFFFFALPNATGKILSMIFPKRKTLYFNNVVVAYKN